MGLTRQQYDQFMLNPPQSWNVYNMDWTNPNPMQYKYWYTIWLALMERIDILNLDYGAYRIETKPPYSVNMNRAYIHQFLEVLFDVGMFYIDMQYCFDRQPIDSFNTYTIQSSNVYNSYIFPYVFNRERLLQLYPSFASIMQPYTVRHCYRLAAWQAKKILIDLYNCINNFRYTCGLYRCPSQPVGGFNRTVYTQNNSYTIDDFRADANNYFNDYSVKIGYREVQPYSEIGYYIRTTDERGGGGVLVGVHAAYQYKSTVNNTTTYAYDFVARPYIIKNFCVQIPSNKTPNLVQLTYVPTLNLQQNNSCNYDTFGYPQGLSLLDLGKFSGHRDVTVVSADQLNYPGFADIPMPQWDATTPKKQHRLLNGCLMSVALLLDYRDQLTYIQLDDSSNND